MKNALICGISGQDGALLADLLVKKGYEIIGTSRDAQISSFNNLVKLGIKDKVKLVSMALTDFRSVLQVLKKYQPDEIYNLAGQSSVGLSFEQPVETLESIASGTLNLLEAMRFLEKPIKFYNAASGEFFGNTGEEGADEETQFRPRSPYAVAKATSFWEVANYRDAYGLFACSGILFNHESALRPKRFVTQKIVEAAKEIAEGQKKILYLGDLSVKRDWGWAPEYVEAMYLMLQQETPEDYVIATGETNSLETFVMMVFRELGLNWKDHVMIDKSLYRPSEIAIGKGRPYKACAKLGWQANFRLKDIVKSMLVENHLTTLY